MSIQQLFPCAASFMGTYNGQPTQQLSMIPQKNNQAPAPIPQQTQASSVRSLVSMIQPYSNISVDEDVSNVLTEANDADYSQLSGGYDMFTGDAGVAQLVAAIASQVAFGGLEITAEGTEVIMSQDSTQTFAAIDAYANNADIEKFNTNDDMKTDM